MRYSVAVGLQVMVAVIAMFVTDLTKIVDYANCFGVTILFFILPSIFLLMALQSFPKGKILAESWKGFELKVMAYLTLTSGVVIFGCGIALASKMK